MRDSLVLFLARSPLRAVAGFVCLGGIMRSECRRHALVICSSQQFAVRRAALFRPIKPRAPSRMNKPSAFNNRAAAPVASPLERLTRPAFRATVALTYASTHFHRLTSPRRFFTTGLDNEHAMQTTRARINCEGSRASLRPIRDEKKELASGNVR